MSYEEEFCDYCQTYEMMDSKTGACPRCECPDDTPGPEDGDYCEDCEGPCNLGDPEDEGDDLAFREFESMSTADVRAMYDALTEAIRELEAECQMLAVKLEEADGA